MLMYKNLFFNNLSYKIIISYILNKLIKIINTNFNFKL